MLRASHFPPLSRQRENGFVFRLPNFVRTYLVKSAHGLARGLPPGNPRYVSSVDPLGPDEQAKQERQAAAKCRKARAVRCPIRPRKRRPGGSSRAGPDRLRSGPGNRRRPDHDGACDILLFRRSPKLIKIFGTSQFKQVMRRARSVPPRKCRPTSDLHRRGDQARDRTPSNACAMKMPAPTRPITAVTISNIANILCPAREQNDVQARTVKRISWMVRTMGRDCGFYATYVPNPSRLQVRPWRDCNVSFTIAKPSPFLPWSPCGIFTTRCGGGDRIVACYRNQPR
jgi:hypothetical protein